MTNSLYFYSPTLFRSLFTPQQCRRDLKETAIKRFLRWTYSPSGQLLYGLSRRLASGNSIANSTSRGCVVRSRRMSHRGLAAAWKACPQPSNSFTRSKQISSRRTIRKYPGWVYRPKIRGRGRVGCDDDGPSASASSVITRSHRTRCPSVDDKREHRVVAALYPGRRRLQKLVWDGSCSQGTHL